MLAKVGRPMVKEPRDKVIHVRLTTDKYEKLLTYAAKNNLTITEIVNESLERIYQTKN